MKNYFIEYMILNNKNMDVEKLIYGLDIIYISFTKLAFILFASILFKCFYITVSCIVLISFLRNFSYGIHMDSSTKCYFFSLFIFVLLPKIFININILNFQALALFLLSIFSFTLYAPADTHKRPLINKKKRKKLKYISLFVIFLYVFFYLYTRNIYISKIILYSVVIQSILINPIIYKLFNLPYKNFKEVMK